ncbi:hypothetical protein GYH30_027640 [Glycine max]|nr:hypothetical protein GYH30_027640 [Glycine max]
MSFMLAVNAICRSMSIFHKKEFPAPIHPSLSHLITLLYSSKQQTSNSICSKCHGHFCVDEEEAGDYITKPLLSNFYIDGQDNIVVKTVMFNNGHDISINVDNIFFKSLMTSTTYSINTFQRRLVH